MQVSVFGWPDPNIGMLLEFKKANFATSQRVWIRPSILHVEHKSDHVIKINQYQMDLVKQSCEQKYKTLQNIIWKNIIVVKA